MTVRDEPEPVVTVPPAAAGTTGGGDAAFEDDEEDEADWYDTASLEPVDQALGSTAEGDDVDDDEPVVAGSAEMAQPDDDQGISSRGRPRPTNGPRRSKPRSKKVSGRPPRSWRKPLPTSRIPRRMKGSRRRVRASCRSTRRTPPT